MKTYQAISLFLLLVFIPGFAIAGEITAAEILKKVDEVEKYDHAIAETEQIITTSGGDKRLLKIKSWAVETGDSQLSVYTYPKRVKGVKILMLNDGDDIWSYSPRTRRIRHLASHAKKQKVMGSDFTYEDMGGGKMSEKYVGMLLKDEVHDGLDCYVVELKPTPKGPSYEKITAWIGKHDFVVRKIDYYNEGDSKAFKTLILRDVQNISDHLVPMEMTMTNHEDGGTTLNRTLNIDFDTPIKKSRFKSNRLNR
ncbi:MAG: outer membrane lipoprotein-sorting protein [Proteobacteria bacterium]|nr:outer membrane lipoprotein-sorting protein [Pseudomonadota bacterium]